MTTYSIPREIEAQLADRDSSEWIGDQLDREAARAWFSELESDPREVLSRTINDRFESE